MAMDTIIDNPITISAILLLLSVPDRYSIPQWMLEVNGVLTIFYLKTNLLFFVAS